MTNFTDIRDFLRAHCARYPELALQDVFKALYQSAFGCEHLIADPSAAADYIRAEAARSGDRISELVELLGGDYCRVHLGILQDGLSAETFARPLCAARGVRARKARSDAHRLADNGRRGRAAVFCAGDGGSC